MEGSKIWTLWEKTEELGGVAVWPQVSLDAMALTSQQEALGPANSPPHPTLGFTLAAVGLLEGVTGSRVGDILGRLKCKHSGGDVCAPVCWGAAAAEVTLRCCLGLGQGPCCRWPDLQRSRRALPKGQPLWFL